MENGGIEKYGGEKDEDGWRNEGVSFLAVCVVLCGEINFFVCLIEIEGPVIRSELFDVAEFLTGVRL